MPKVRSPYPANRFLTDLRFRGPHACYGEGKGGTRSKKIGGGGSRTDRELLEAREEAWVMPWATLSRCNDLNDGRIYETPPEEEDMRPRFARDRDRIIHAHHFLLMDGKSQVFPILFTRKPLGENSARFDPIRDSRLYHVLRVQQLARTLARPLRINEDLVEAGALGHDMGHVPFGHAGERAIQTIQKEFEPNSPKFRHETFGVTVISEMEQIVKMPFPGLNLTIEVLDAIAHHCGEKPKIPLRPRRVASFEKLTEDLYRDVMPFTLEGCLIRLLDIVGYAPQDFHNFRTAGLIKENKSLKRILSLLGYSAREMFGTLVRDIKDQTLKDLQSGKIQINMSPEIFKALVNLRKFNGDVIQELLGKFENKVITPEIKMLYKFYLEKEDDFSVNAFARKLVGMTDETLSSRIEVLKAYLEKFTDLEKEKPKKLMSEVKTEVIPKDKLK